MDALTFNKFRNLIYDKSGIVLKEGKETLVEARIGKRLRELGLSSPKEYFNHVSEDREGLELVLLLDAISTNVTHFFREADHFDFMRQLVGNWQSKGQKKFRIWCAASSTGEEPYTMSMVLSDLLTGPGIDLKILATDISTKVLNKAKAAVYDKKGLDDIPSNYKISCTEMIPGTNNFEIKEELKSLVTFSRINLSKPPFPMKGPFDIVFCRNVMIYFDDEVRTRLVKEIHGLLKPGGFLFVAHSETLTGLPVDFQIVRPSVYWKKGEHVG